MPSAPPTAFPPSSRTLHLFDGIAESDHEGFVVLAPQGAKPKRRIAFVNSYGGKSVLERIRNGSLAPHHLWGCLELVRCGYAILLAEPLRHFSFRKPLPHDLKLFSLLKSWLGRDGILYSGHTLLYWLPLLRMCGALPCRIVSMTYAREGLDFCRFHDGIVALTPAAESQARMFAPRAKVAHISWGADLGFYPQLPYEPESFLSCGIANRDFRTLSAASFLTQQKLEVIYPGVDPAMMWSSRSRVFDGGRGWHTDSCKPIDVSHLVSSFYPHSAASLIVMKADPTEYTANGFTNLLEAMAVGRPVIATRTGALPGELDIESNGCGIFVPPNDPRALARAMDDIANNSTMGKAMGDRGRMLCERHYNLRRCATDLDRFFDDL